MRVADERLLSRLRMPEGRAPESEAKWLARESPRNRSVDAAADSLLKTGDRPTIDRVRAILGPGSQSTLVKLVDDWWSSLGERLVAQEAKLALPLAPKEVVDAASALWMSALERARQLAAAGLA